MRACSTYRIRTAPKSEERARDLCPHRQGRQESGHAGLPIRKRPPISRGPSLVREGGFEPPRPFGHWHLKPARLPFRHSRAPEKTSTQAGRGVMGAPGPPDPRRQPQPRGSRTLNRRKHLPMGTPDDARGDHMEAIAAIDQRLSEIQARIASFAPRSTPQPARRQVRSQAPSHRPQPCTQKARRSPMSSPRFRNRSHSRAALRSRPPRLSSTPTASPRASPATATGASPRRRWRPSPARANACGRPRPSTSTTSSPTRRRRASPSPSPTRTEATTTKWPSPTRRACTPKAALAAAPGTSEHGWGLAVDLGLDATSQAWMRQHAKEYGFVDNVPREPWHWQFAPSA